MAVMVSSKTCPAVTIVTTSLNMPAMLRVTTLVRWRSANSEAVMQKAIKPGKRRIKGPRSLPFLSINSPRPTRRFIGPSTPEAIINKLQNIIGAKKKILENGFDVAGFRNSKICVSAHLKPEKKAAEMTRMKPKGEKSTSPDTIMTTPNVMVAMMRMSFQEGISRRKRKAKRRTKAREEDLHIAGEKLAFDLWSRGEGGGRTNCKTSK